MLGNVYVLIDDTKKVSYTQTFYDHNSADFEIQNKLGWGVYCSVNNFEATTEQMTAIGAKTKRNIPFLTKINAVFADLDIAKSGDGQTREQKDSKINKVIQAIEEICPPSKIIYTSNGIQPLWSLSEFPTDVDSQNKYIRIINGIIEWSKTVGCAGDEVKDVTRIVRVPGYYHMKEEPFMVYLQKDADIKYRFEDIEIAFGKYVPKQDSEFRDMEFREERQYKTLKQYQEIDRLDFKDIICRAYGSIGRSCEFDKEDRVILDGRLTGTFQGKKDSRRYLATTSHEPFKGNTITSVADILQVSNKEAYKWILETFNIKTETELRKNDMKEEKIEEVKKNVATKFRHIGTEERLLRGYEELMDTNPDDIIKWGWEEWDSLLGGIYGGKIYLIGANTGIGKSTFVDQVVKNVAAQGVRVVKYSLEDRIEDKVKEELYFTVNKLRYADGRKKYEWTKFVNNEYRDGEFRNYVNKAVEVLAKLETIELDKDKQVNIDELVMLMEEECKNGTRLFVIDHLHYFEFEGNKNDRLDLQIQNVMHNLNEIARKKNIAIMLVAHYRNTTQKLKDGERPDPSWFKDAASIKQVANIIIQIDRDMSNDEGQTKFFFTKLRGPIKQIILESGFDMGIYGYDFKKTQKQTEKEALYFND